jgi:hypothetical protein
VIRADFKCGSSHRHAKSTRTGRNLGDALDGTSAPGHCRNSRAKSSANGFHPICNASTSRRQTGALAAIWECATRSRLPSSHLEIVSPLSRLIPPATLIDKPAYSAFAESILTAFLREKKRYTCGFGAGPARLPSWGSHHVCGARARRTAQHDVDPEWNAGARR